MTTPSKIQTPNRRLFLGANAVALSAGAVALLGGAQALAAASPADIRNDIGILNVAVGLEYEGINAYAIALKSGLLSEAHVKAATKFQDDHQQHNDALISTIRKLGGTPVEPRTLDDLRRERRHHLPAGVPV